MRRFDVVLIEWDDIVSQDGAWVAEGEGIRPEDGEVFTVGIVTKVEKAAVTVVRDRLPYGKEVGGEQRIPRGVIRTVHRIGRVVKRGKKWEFEKVRSQK